MTLLVKRGCDEGFQPLGDVIKMWGRVPFAPGPSPPPLLVRQPPPTQRPQPTRGPAGTVSQSSANVEDGEGRMQRRGKIDRQVTVKDQQLIPIQFDMTGSILKVSETTPHLILRQKSVFCHFDCAEINIFLHSYRKLEREIHIQIIEIINKTIHTNVIKVSGCM